MKRTRSYPECCLSFSCGRIDCTDCRNKPIHDEFLEWVERTKAKVEDRIWCPTVYTAQIDE